MKVIPRDVPHTLVVSESDYSWKLDSTCKGSLGIIQGHCSLNLNTSSRFEHGIITFLKRVLELGIAMGSISQIRLFYVESVDVNLLQSGMISHPTHL